MPKKPEAAVGPELIVGQRIRQERQLRGWSLDAMAAKMKRSGTPLAPSALSLVETGKRRISLNEAVVFAKVLGLDLADLMEPQGSQQELEAALMPLHGLMLEVWQAMEEVQRALYFANRAIVGEQDYERGEAAVAVRAALFTPGAVPKVHDQGVKEMAEDLGRAWDAWDALARRSRAFEKQRAPGLAARRREAEQGGEQ